MLERVSDSVWRVWQDQTLIGEYDNLRAARLAEDTVRQWEYRVSQGENPPPLIPKAPRTTE